MTALVVRVSGTVGGTGAFVAASRTTAGGRYRLAATPERVVCTCLGYVNRSTCWHVAAVAELIQVETRQRAAERLEEIAREFGL